ncbi:hypothetical protein pneo_cds_333 [Pandoravirus neocaledonia]|uniref:Uncharacterized protein n=1 Tax=Pandoravirus neocaledonia TaxID=2107708 RepID=A0A2U7UC89_9VIRU|nr:hypothetical protein pneo_cds_333 [Pandoravirus neocaledonia]AVK75940.1 hypothetical protein pneo_cds_333 [Pandoravirus neocaledonia]
MNDEDHANGYANADGLADGYPDGMLFGVRDGFNATPASAWPRGFVSGLEAEEEDGRDDRARRRFAPPGQSVGAQEAAAVDADAIASVVLAPDAADVDPVAFGLPEGATGLPEIDVVLSGVTDLHPGARFADGAEAFAIEINVDPVDAAAIVDFWSGIMRDHMAFLGAWLIDAPLAGNGDVDGAAYDDVGAFKRRARDLEAAWDAFIAGPQLDSTDGAATLQDLVAATGLLKTRILDAVRAGQYVGSVYESFLLDNLMEVDYFVDALAGNVGGQAEIDMWNEHARGHALLDAHLLDPLMVKEIIEALVLAEQFLAVSDGLPREPLAAPTPLDALGARATADEAITQAMQRLAAQARTPAAASAAYLGALEVIRARMEGAGARVSGVAPHRLVVHTIREVAYGLERIAQIEAGYA